MLNLLKSTHNYFKEFPCLPIQGASLYKIILTVLPFFLITFLFLPKAFAIENPLAVQNNKFGIHILFTEEIKEAYQLVNSNGGDWGYITIPIQAGDKNIEKWQNFMDQSKKLHVIPIIRLASEGDYFNTTVWRKPVFADVLDFANFLNSLKWPTKNRYVVIFNEPNRGDEWGGTPDPSDYANILNFAVDTFKSKNKDFFVISAGLDNAAATVPGKSYSTYNFMVEMNNALSGIFTKIDGLGSHSYPNPAFAQPPTQTGFLSVSSFRNEKNLAMSFGADDIPVFITETGWSKDAVTNERIASYYRIAFNSVWNQKDIAAVTPFLFKAGSPPFNVFSFVSPDGSKSEEYKAFEEIQKNKGNPAISTESAVLKKEVLGKETGKNLEIIDFSNFLDSSFGSIYISSNIKSLIKWFFQI